MKYHSLEMSDFETELSQKRGLILAEAISLDFVMWKAKNHRSRVPWRLLSEKPSPPYYGGLPNYASESDLVDHANQFQAELVERIYWQGKPSPRRSTQERPESIRSLLSDEVNRHVHVEIRELADRLNLSERHVRRKLGQLLKIGKIPITWREGEQWRPPVAQAERIIRESEAKRHRAHTHANGDVGIDQIVRCRLDADRLTADLKELNGQLELCQRFIRLNHKKGLSLTEYGAARKWAFNFLNDLARKWGWSFCKLLVAIYSASLNRSTTLMVDTIGFLGLDHANFYRIYTANEIRTARKMAEVLIANNGCLPERLKSDVESDEIAKVFEDAASKVSEKICGSIPIECWNRRMIGKLRRCLKNHE